MWIAVLLTHHQSTGNGMVSLSANILDASNLHVGGGVQVGASLVNEIAGLISARTEREYELARAFDYLVSTEIAENLLPATWEELPGLKIADSSPGRWTAFPRQRYRVAFTTFGPAYRRRRADFEIVGFALPRLITLPQLVGLPEASARERVLNRVRWAAFGRADCIVTETASASRAVQRRLDSLQVRTIPNAVTTSLNRSIAWRGVQPSPSGYRFAIIARDYPHKNLSFIEELGPRLEEELGMAVTFLVTLSDQEWSRRSTVFRRYAHNLGVVAQRDLAQIYCNCHAALLPSLLEVSSATPAESMSLGVPTLVSDLEAFHDQYGDNVGYFDPHDATQAAVSISTHLKDPLLAERLQAAKDWVSHQPSAEERARSILEFLGLASSPLGIGMDSRRSSGGFWCAGVLHDSPHAGSPARQACGGYPAPRKLTRPPLHTRRTAEPGNRTQIRSLAREGARARPCQRAPVPSSCQSPE